MDCRKVSKEDVVTIIQSVAIIAVAALAILHKVNDIQEKVEDKVDTHVN